MTVLFADVVHSMDIAVTVGAERLREIMAELVNRAAAVVKRYGGAVDKFTGDGIMAVFGAPLALEDHAVRACLAASDMQDEIARLAAEVGDHDGVELALRIGLNSGQVIAGEVGSASLGYTTIGEQVGMTSDDTTDVDPSGDDGRGALTAAGLSCTSCRTELPPNSKFCNECGTPLRPAATNGGVQAGDGAVRRRGSFDGHRGGGRCRAAARDHGRIGQPCGGVVKRYGGTVDKFTGDGIMAVFGAPVALEDHAVRACLAALDVQDEAKRLAEEVQRCDGADLRLRIGLNSGQVIAGEIGSGALGYTAIGEQVGMAQRMESIARRVGSCLARPPRDLSMA